jgi:hypothetical protein
MRDGQLLLLPQPPSKPPVGKKHRPPDDERADPLVDHPGERPEAEVTAKALSPDCPPQVTEYEGGVYHGKLVFPPDYPFKPPS